MFNSMPHERLTDDERSESTNSTGWNSAKEEEGEPEVGLNIGQDIPDLVPLPLF